MNVQMPNAQTRQYIYRVVVVAIPLLVAGGFIAPDQVGLWMELAAAVLGLPAVGLASTALKKQRTTGVVE